MTNFKIKIVSDTVCPWCYIGKKRLDKVIELYRAAYPGGRDDTFTVSWHPFYLDPHAPRVGVPLLERMQQRFGGAGRLEPLLARLKAVGGQEGIAFSFGSRIGSTRDSHRLIQLGRTKGGEVQNRVVLELFRLYFEGDADITSHDTLLAAARNAGLDEAEVRSWLEDGSGGAEVDAEVTEANRKGIHGVPNFDINGVEVDGAQEPQAFLEEFVKIKEGR